MNKVKQMVCRCLIIFIVATGSLIMVPISQASEVEGQLKAGAPLAELIDGATAKLLEDGKLNTDWEALAVARSNTPASQELRQARYNEIIEYLNTTPRLSVTDYERTIIGLVALGADPTQLPEATEHQDLIRELYHHPQVLNGGVNAIIYGLLALQTKDFEVPADANFSIPQLVAQLVSLQKADGGWALFGTVSDIDITGMALTALSNYHDLPGVNESVAQGVAYLSGIQLDSGGFKSPGDWSAENSSSAAQVLMALTLNNVDPTSKAFTKQMNVVEALTAYRLPDGGFKWLPTDAEGNIWALEQAVYSLAQYQLFLTGGGSIYDFVGNPVSPLVQEPVVPEEPELDPTPKPDPIPTPDPQPKPDPLPTPSEPVQEADSSVTSVDSITVVEGNSIPSSIQKSEALTVTGKQQFPKTGEEQPNLLLISLSGGVSIGLGGWLYSQNKSSKKKQFN